MSTATAIPIICRGCGATGKVASVTADLSCPTCKTGANLDLHEEVMEVTADWTSDSGKTWAEIYTRGRSMGMGQEQASEYADSVIHRNGSKHALWDDPSGPMAKLPSGTPDQDQDFDLVDPLREVKVTVPKGSAPYSVQALGALDQAFGALTKHAQIMQAVLRTNPGMDPRTAARVADKTLAKYPALVKRAAAEWQVIDPVQMIEVLNGDDLQGTIWPLGQAGYRWVVVEQPAGDGAKHVDGGTASDRDEAISFVEDTLGGGTTASRKQADWVSISNPDDPHGVPIYEGEDTGAGTMLSDGTYPGVDIDGDFLDLLISNGQSTVEYLPTSYGEDPHFTGLTGSRKQAATDWGTVLDQAVAAGEHAWLEGNPNNVWRPGFVNVVIPGNSGLARYLRTNNVPGWRGPTGYSPGWSYFVSAPKGVNDPRVQDGNRKFAYAQAFLGVLGANGVQGTIQAIDD